MTAPDTPESTGSSGAVPPRVRRPHRKSRRGCRPCKASRIKCDESQPACSNCIRKEIKCNYFETVRTTTSGPKQRIRIPPLERSTSPEEALPALILQGSWGPNLSSSDRISTALVNYCPYPATVGTPRDSLLDLRLFHHYHTMAAKSSAAQKLWSIWTVDMAVNSATVMDAVLGFSAFHLRRLGSRDLDICEASHKYMIRAIRSHKEQVQLGLNESNAAPMIVSCALILFHTTMNQDFLTIKSGPQLPLHWFHPFQSAGAFFRLMWPWLQDTLIGQNIWGRFAPLDIQTEEFPQHRFDFLLENMEPEYLQDEDIMTAYQGAVSHLSLVVSNPRYRRLLQFPATVTPRFVEMLEAEDPRTLVIVGYFFMLVKQADVLWWVEGAAEREFDAVMSFLPESWWPLMGYAIQEFQWSPNGAKPAQMESPPHEISWPVNEKNLLEYPDLGVFTSRAR
ncbi:hypothetical protein BGZ61DRAFT_489336 [Ilyonectria robusta]|uniref:uncharacterized protein n=1 Tax=Ilyonectria robusta TaxID=1079257 RepID=UPI001E8E5653|nr:uncharacterized protein BGZ61DRAFT_489336 [Ilyonectria robusta]KAH8738426.1 hypothetical protein BGZ61DRAFT_489336 [Ilyonectria robusta]